MIRLKSKNFFGVAVFIILIIATVLRFYNFDARWGLAYDQAHDALIAKYAVENFKIPLLGPFSSAGAFQTGGEWYWIVMLGTILFPFTVTGPWIFITFLYVLFVFIIILIAREFVDKTFSIIVGLIVTVSTGQIAQSVSLTNQSPQAFFSLLAIWCSIRFLRTKKRIYIFLLALFVSTAASIHLQGAALSMLVVFTFLFSGVPKISSILLAGLGLFLPWIPVLVVDLQNNFYNTKNMINYYIYDQYKISLDVLGRRWLTFLGVFWPKMWSFVVGGNILFGYAAGISLLYIFVYKIWKKTMQKEWIVLLFSFFGMVIIMRYTRTPLFESYIVFLHPFIFLLSSWIIYLIYKKQKIIGCLILVVILIFSLFRSLQEINYPGNPLIKPGQILREDLIKEFPNTKFAVYDFNNKTTSTSFPLVLFLDEKKLNDKDGKRVGISLNKEKSKYIAIDLSKKTHVLLRKEGWHLVTPEKVYISTQDWYKLGVEH